MAEEKDKRIWEEIKRIAKTEIRFGSMSTEFKIQNGEIIQAVIKPTTISIV